MFPLLPRTAAERGNSALFCKVISSFPFELTEKYLSRVAKILQEGIRPIKKKKERKERTERKKLLGVLKKQCFPFDIS